MRIGMLVNEDVYRDTCKLIEKQEIDTKIEHFESLERAYYALFSQTDAPFTELVLQGKAGADGADYDEALDRLIRCAKQHFPGLRIYTLYSIFNTPNEQCEAEYPLSELGMRRLVVDLKNHEDRDKPDYIGMSDSGRIDTLYQKYEMMLNYAGEAIVGINRHGRITFVNQFACDLFECSERELLGSHLSDFALDSPLDEGSSPDSFTGTGRVQRRVGRGVIRRKNGKLTCVEYTQTYVGNSHDDTVSVMVIEDISSRVKFEAKLQTLASIDPLTGLYNRHYLKRAFNKARKHQRKGDRQGALFYIDLDGFKQVNDKHGHSMGDKLLIAITERLKASCRRSDLIARIGGDEFVILTEQSGMTDLEKMARHLLAELSASCLVEHRTLHVSASIGIALIESEQESLETLIERADQAMYSVKRNGKGSFTFDGNVAQMQEDASEPIES